MRTTAAFLTCGLALSTLAPPLLAGNLAEPRADPVIADSSMVERESPRATVEAKARRTPRPVRQELDADRLAAVMALLLLRQVPRESVPALVLQGGAGR